MSDDLGVWYSDSAMTRQEAAAFYRHINRDWVVVRRHPAFDAFWTELLARFPNLGNAPADPDEPPESMLQTMDDIRRLPPPRPEQLEAIRHVVLDPEEDKSPWAAALKPEGSAVALPIRGSRIGETEAIVHALAARHGLVVYNPQSEVTLPAALLRSPACSATKPGPVLRVAGTAPSLAVTISLDGRTLVETEMASRQEAHARARALAAENDRSYYLVDDPNCLAQSFKLEPVPETQLRKWFGESTFPRLAPGHPEE